LYEIVQKHGTLGHQRQQPVLFGCCQKVKSAFKQSKNKQGEQPATRPTRPTRTHKPESYSAQTLDHRASTLPDCLFVCPFDLSHKSITGLRCPAFELHARKITVALIARRPFAGHTDSIKMDPRQQQLNQQRIMQQHQQPMQPPMQPQGMQPPNFGQQHTMQQQPFGMTHNNPFNVGGNATSSNNPFGSPSHATPAFHSQMAFNPHQQPQQGQQQPPMWPQQVSARKNSLHCW
jgi:hypothetical protein